MIRRKHFASYTYSDCKQWQGDWELIYGMPYALKSAYIKKAPKVIFEILSKSTANRALNLKYELYEKEGVEYYIIVDGADKIAKVYYLQNGRYTKVVDAHNEIVDFKLKECNFSFDFSKIW